MADGRSKKSCGSGHVSISLNEDVALRLSSVLYALDLSYDLISVSSLTENGIKLTFEGNECRLEKNGIIIGVVFKDPNTKLYKIPDNCFKSNLNKSMTAEFLLWHNRSGHAGKKRVLLLHKYLNDVAKLKCNFEGLCEPYEKGKAHRLPYIGKWEESTVPGHIIFSDVAGPYKCGNEGQKYFITFAYNYSKHTWVVTSKSKGVIDYFQSFLTAFNDKIASSTHYQTKVRILRIHVDKGKEQQPIQRLYENLELSTTTGYEAADNPIAERMNRTLKDQARAMLIAADVPNSFWPDAIEDASRLYNILPCSSIGMTPHEKPTGKEPSAKHWRIFGTKAFVYIPNEKLSGCEPKALSGILTGCFPYGIHRVFSEKGITIESKDVKIDENVYHGRSFLRLCGLMEKEDEDLELDTDSTVSEDNSIGVYQSTIKVLDFDSDVSTDSTVTGRETTDTMNTNNLSSRDNENEENDIQYVEKDLNKDNNDKIDSSTIENYEELLTHVPVRSTTSIPKISRYPQRNRNRVKRFDSNANIAITTSDKPTMKQI